jgi:hypothetical protein
MTPRPSNFAVRLQRTVQGEKTAMLGRPSLPVRLIPSAGQYAYELRAPHAEQIAERKRVKGREIVNRRVGR